MSPNYLLIANPISGGNARSQIHRAIRWFEKHDVELEVFLTSARGDAARAAAEAQGQPFRKIVVAGGDGTLNEVINGAGDTEIPLAFIPLGTVNVFALETGLPLAVDEACRVAHEGSPRQIFLGMAGDTRFVLMAGVGFDAAAVYGLDARLKRWTGKMAYIASAARLLLGPGPTPIEMTTAEGRTARGFSAVIGNGRLYGGRFSLTPQADLQDASLQICLFKRWGRLHLLRFAALVAAGRSLQAPDVELIKTSSATFKGENVPVQVDGDYLGRLPMTFRIIPRALTFVLPAVPGDAPSPP